MSLLLPRDNQARPCPLLLQPHLMAQLHQRPPTAQLFPHRTTLQHPLWLLSLLKFSRTTTPLPSPQRDPLAKGQVFHRRRCERLNALNIFLGSHNFFFQCTSTLPPKGPAPAVTPSVFHSLPSKRFLTWLLNRSTYTY